MARRRSNSSGTGRVVFLLGLFGILLMVVFGRLVWIQVVDSKAYAQQATAQRMTDVVLKAHRGTIYDRDGEVLAVSVDARTIYATPNAIKDKQGTAQALASVLGGDSATYETKLARKSSFVYIARQVDIEVAEKLEAMELEGIGFLEDSKRVYPSGELACQVLGFVGVDGEGLAGLEKQYDSILAGKDGLLLGERDPYGRLIPGGIQKTVVEPADGQDIVLSIDKDIQNEAQTELAAAVSEWGAESGSVIVMNPKTGEIYAMASVPFFDPNNYREASTVAIRNAAICDTYEPGSTIKAITAASAINEKLYTPDSMFTLPPTLQVGTKTIHDSHERGTVNWSLTQIVTNSSNVGAVMMGSALGNEGLYSYLCRFGLNDKTGVDFPGEGKGLLAEPQKWSAAAAANIPFGQGLSMTPLQLVRAIAALGNGGTLVTPHFLLDLPQNESYEGSWATASACTAETAKTTTNVLAQVVSDGTGSEAAIAGYPVAGKTGTAQVALPDGGGYAKGTYIASFIGYLPADDPQLLIAVKLDKPSNSIYGGTVAAPAFSAIGQFAAAHLNITPSAESSRTGQ
ncbi:MAG: peptidoglycan D,D-transpeptidase FtsI family protein [Coriobacteriia bacterium]